MTIGNLSLKIRQTPTTHSVVMVALVPIPVKNRNNTQKRLDEQRQTNREVLNEVLRWVLQPLTFNNIPALRAGITTFSVQMATSGVTNQFYQHGLQIAESVATYIILSDMSVFVASVQRTNLEIMCILTSNTPGGIKTYIEGSAMPIPRKPMPNSRCTMFTKESTCFDTFPVL
jgi:hypothetical protein